MRMKEVGKKRKKDMEGAQTKGEKEERCKVMDLINMGIV